MVSGIYASNASPGLVGELPDLPGQSSSVDPDCAIVTEGETTDETTEGDLSCSSYVTPR